MFKLIKLILGLCDHKWKVRESGNIKKAKNGDTVGYFYILECKNCGEIKYKEFI